MLDCEYHTIVGGKAISASDQRFVETLIIGQGIAGTAVAWELFRRGENFLVVDADDSRSASKVAAGLITPVAGKRFAVAEHFNELYACAVASYTFIEQHLTHPCFQTQPALRFCYTDEEVELFEQRADWLRLSGHIAEDTASLSGLFRESQRTVFMPGAARLNTRNYLEQSRLFFESNQALLSVRLDPDLVEPGEGHILCPSLKLKARRIVFCGGYKDQNNPWFPDSVFNSAKGEILTVRISGLNESRTVHARNSWLCPTHSEDLYLFGATYEHDAFSHGTTADARSELAQRLESIVTCPFQIVDQQFGVRPIGMQRKAIAGRNSKHRQISWLNGLGSKGALLAPYLASMLVDSVLSDAPIRVDLTEAHTHG